jgi:hypothetical protein
VRNPWGKRDLPKLWTEKIKEATNCYEMEKGAFWMDFEDLCQYYRQIWICQPLTRKEKRCEVKGIIKVKGTPTRLQNQWSCRWVNQPQSCVVRWCLETDMGGGDRVGVMCRFQRQEGGRIHMVVAGLPTKDGIATPPGATYGGGTITFGEGLDRAWTMVGFSQIPEDVRFILTFFSTEEIEFTFLELPPEET